MGMSTPHPVAPRVGLIAPTSGTGRRGEGGILPAVQTVGRDVPKPV